MQPGNWNFLIWIAPTIELEYKSCMMNLQTDFRQNEIKLQLFAQPFALVVEDCPDDFQMELINLQADMETKKYSEKFGKFLQTLCV